jgi:hypothetical protein
MATGIEEAVNLGWKLAAVLRGWGGPRLLPTYETERRPIAMRNVALSTRTFRAIEAIPGWSGKADDSALDTWRRDLGVYSIPDHVKFQQSYWGSPICVPDGSQEPEAEPDTYLPSAASGARAPHCWLDENRSSLDLFDSGFTLLRFDTSRETAMFKSSAQRVGLPLEVVDVNSKPAADLYGAALVLVRPDGHVAWRGDDASRAREMIDVVRGG